MMNRFTELSRSVREELAAERREKETASERAAREAQEKLEAEAALLDEAVMPILQEIRDGLSADDLNARISLRSDSHPAAELVIDAGTTTEDEGKDRVRFVVGRPAKCTVTTAGGGFVIEIAIPDQNISTLTANRAELDETLDKAVRKMLRYRLNPFNL